MTLARSAKVFNKSVKVLHTECLGCSKWCNSRVLGCSKWCNSRVLGLCITLISFLFKLNRIVHMYVHEYGILIHIA